MSEENGSQQNAELAERAIDGYNRRDVDVIAQHMTVDHEWFPAVPGLVEGNGYAGREGIETYLAEIGEVWERLVIVETEIRDHKDFILVLGRLEGRGLGSGVAVDAPIGLVFELRDERTWRTRAYLDHGEALRAAGLK